MHAALAKPVSCAAHARRSLISPKELFVGARIAAAFLGAMFGLLQCSGSYGCDNLQTETGLPTKCVATTCYVKVKGQWVPEQNWRPGDE